MMYTFLHHPYNLATLRKCQVNDERLRRRPLFSCFFTTFTMATSVKWYEIGVFKFYTFPEDLLVKVPVKDCNLTGICNACKEPKSAWFGNPSNLVRHLLVGAIKF